MEETAREKCLRNAFHQRQNDKVTVGETMRRWRAARDGDDCRGRQKKRGN